MPSNSESNTGDKGVLRVLMSWCKFLPTKARLVRILNCKYVFSADLVDV